MYGKANPHSEEVKQKIFNTLKKLYKIKDGYWLGKHHSDLTKQKMSIQRKARKLVRRKENYKPWNKGIPMSETNKAQLRNLRRGTTMGIETRNKISEALKGRLLSDSHIQRLKERTGIHNPFYGNHHTEETKKKLSQANLGKIWATKENIHKRIKVEELETYLLQGFHRGRK